MGVAPKSAKSFWRLVKNRLHLISERDADPLEYFRAERARESSVRVLSVETCEKFQDRLRGMIGAYDAWCADPDKFDPAEFGDPWDDSIHAHDAAENEVDLGANGGGVRSTGNFEVALLKQKHRNDLSNMEHRLQESEAALEFAEMRIQQLEHEVQNLRENTRLALNNEALEVELQTQRAVVPDKRDSVVTDPFEELSSMLQLNGKLLSDLTELRSGTHIGYNRIVALAERYRR